MGLHSQVLGARTWPYLFLGNYTLCQAQVMRFFWAYFLIYKLEIILPTRIVIDIKHKMCGKPLALWWPYNKWSVRIHSEFQLLLWSDTLEKRCDLALHTRKLIFTDQVPDHYRKWRSKFPTNNSSARQSWKSWRGWNSGKNQAGLILLVNKYLLSAD